MRNFKLLIAVGDVPSGQIVTKPTGSKPYRVTRTIEIAGQPPIECRDGCVFMCPDDGGKIQAVHAESEVVWELSQEQLFWLVSECRDSD
ncbi:hypothetical protein [Kordiimonas sp.]|uniref:hypothetical protein n=1 Tax=Kordiimonas sp. TaxID=1970157 RepID=UPI003A900D25